MAILTPILRQLLLPLIQMNIRKGVIYHVLGWTLYLLIIAMSADKVDRDFILKSLSIHLPAILVFYINTLLIFPFLLKRKQYLPTILFMITVCAVAVLVRALFSPMFPEYLWPFDRIMFWVQFRLNILFAGLSLAYWYAKENYRNEQKSLQLEKEISDARLTLLKNQLNPHFLYNALSLIYSKALPLSEEVATLVGKISEMLRYSLQETELINALVPLEKELTHIKNYLDIQQLRFGKNIKIDFQINGSVEKINIAPMLLITFIENAFKHGDHKQPFKIEVDATGESLEFEVWNGKTQGSKDSSSGIGLENVKNRLKLLYPDRHRLVIRDGQDYFSVHLTINNQV